MDREDGEASPGLLGAHRGHRRPELRREGHGQEESSWYVPRAPSLALPLSREVAEPSATGTPQSPGAPETASNQVQTCSHCSRKPDLLLVVRRQSRFRCQRKLAELGSKCHPCRCEIRFVLRELYKKSKEPPKAGSSGACVVWF